MNKTTTYIIITITFLVAAGSWIYQLLTEPKIGYVRSHDMIYRYEGTKRAQANFQQKSQQWQARVDTLKMEYRKALHDYQRKTDDLTEQEKEHIEERLNKQQQQIQQYTRAIGQKTQDEDEQRMQEVLNQVNSYVKEYAKKHNYDIVYGTTMSGNILYGKDEYDITDDVLEYLNRKYRGE